MCESKEQLCCHDYRTGYICEYECVWACQHPYANGIVLTSTLNGAHPANCPKIPGNEISQEEKERRAARRGKRGKSFRYGGLRHDYEATAKDFGQMHCYHCHKPFDDDEKPYCRIFPVGNGQVMFGLICRRCAYCFGDGVIEKDGETYYKPDEYLEDEVDKNVF